LGANTWRKTECSRLATAQKDKTWGKKKNVRDQYRRLGLNELKDY